MESQVQVTAYVGLGLDRPSLELKKLEDSVATELENAGIGGATILEGRGLWRSADGTCREPCATVVVIVANVPEYRQEAVKAITAAVKRARPNEQEMLVTYHSLLVDTVRIAE